jgi:hypothetical protein
MASPGDFSLPTAPITIDGHGIVLNPKPLAWDVGSPNYTDLWHDPIQREGAGIHYASHSNAQTTEPSHDDNTPTLSTDVAERDFDTEGDNSATSNANIQYERWQRQVEPSANQRRPN